MVDNFYQALALCSGKTVQRIESPEDPTGESCEHIVVYFTDNTHLTIGAHFVEHTISAILYGGGTK